MSQLKTILPEVSTELSPDDTMFEGDHAHYFSVGRSALRAIQVAAQAAQKEEFRNILDFGCGFGRVLRVLRAAYQEADLAACDLSREAVDFCAKTFGAEPFYSDEAPSKVAIARSFDLIWCGTMLTNLDASAFEEFLRLFASLLSKDGLLVFTTHGPFVAERIRTSDCTYGLEENQIPAMLQEYESSGFAFLDYPQEVLTRLNVSRYGISVSKPSWVCRQVEQLPGLRIVMYTEKAWDNHQDAVACLRT